MAQPAGSKLRIRLKGVSKNAAASAAHTKGANSTAAGGNVQMQDLRSVVEAFCSQGVNSLPGGMLVDAWNDEVFLEQQWNAMAPLEQHSQQHQQLLLCSPGTRRVRKPRTQPLQWQGCRARSRTHLRRRRSSAALQGFMRALRGDIAQPPMAATTPAGAKAAAAAALQEQRWPQTGQKLQQQQQQQQQRHLEHHRQQQQISGPGQHVPLQQQQPQQVRQAPRIAMRGMSQGKQQPQLQAARDNSLPQPVPGSLGQQAVQQATRQQQQPQPHTPPQVQTEQPRPGVAVQQGKQVPAAVQQQQQPQPSSAAASKLKSQPPQPPQQQQPQQQQPQQQEGPTAMEVDSQPSVLASPAVAGSAAVLAAPAPVAAEPAATVAAAAAANTTQPDPVSSRLRPRQAPSSSQTSSQQQQPSAKQQEQRQEQPPEQPGKQQKQPAKQQEQTAKQQEQAEKQQREPQPPVALQQQQQQPQKAAARKQSGQKQKAEAQQEGAPPAKQRRLNSGKTAASDSAASGSAAAGTSGPQPAGKAAPAAAQAPASAAAAGVAEPAAGAPKAAQGKAARPAAGQQTAGNAAASKPARKANATAAAAGQPTEQLPLGKAGAGAVAASPRTDGAAGVAAGGPPLAADAAGQGALCKAAAKTDSPPSETSHQQPIAAAVPQLMQRLPPQLPSQEQTAVSRDRSQCSLQQQAAAGAGQPAGAGSQPLQGGAAAGAGANNGASSAAPQQPGSYGMPAAASVPAARTAPKPHLLELEPAHMTPAAQALRMTAVPAVTFRKPLPEKPVGSQEEAMKLIDKLFATARDKKHIGDGRMKMQGGWDIMALNYYALSSLEFLTMQDAGQRMLRQLQDRRLPVAKLQDKLVAMDKGTSMFKQVGGLCSAALSYCSNCKGPDVAKQALRMLLERMAAICQLKHMHVQREALVAQARLLKSATQGAGRAAPAAAAAGQQGGASGSQQQQRSTSVPAGRPPARPVATVAAAAAAGSSSGVGSSPRGVQQAFNKRSPDDSNASNQERINLPGLVQHEHVSPGRPAQASSPLAGGAAGGGSVGPMSAAHQERALLVAENQCAEQLGELLKVTDGMHQTVMRIQQFLETPEVLASEEARAAATHISVLGLDAGMYSIPRIVAHAEAALASILRYARTCNASS